LREEALRTGGRVFEARCSHYHPGSPFYPVAEMIARAIDYKPECGEEAVGALESIIGGFALEPRSVVPYLAGLLSLPLPERLALPMLSAQALRERTFEALLGLLGAIAADQPLLLVIEDLQWSDPSTLELIARALERNRSARLLLLCTARSEFAPPPQLSFERLELGRCPDAVLEKLVRGFALADPFPDKVVAGIVARADGVPLFAEELARAVRETGSVEIPATLQDLLMARLDRLGPAKPVAQQAAAIGRRFSFVLLRAVTALDAGPLAEALEHAAQVGLVSSHGTPPEARYAFRHALFEDIAYQSMLRSTRQQIHRRVAEAILQVDPQTAEIQPEVLAHHYTEAALLDEAVSFWLRAGRRALARSACVEAVTHVRRGLELAQSLPADAARHARELELQLVLAPALMAVRGAVADEVEQAYAQAGALSRQLGNTPKLLVPLWGLWAYALMRARYGEARMLAAQLARLAELSKAPGPALVAAETLGMTLFYQGELAAALAALRRGLALYRRPDAQARQARGVHDPGVMCHAFEMLALWLSGQTDAAIDSLARLRALDGVLEPYDRAFTRCAFAVLSQCRQDPAAVAGHAAEALAISREQGFPTWAAMARVLQGWALAQQGRADEGVALARRGCEAWDATGAQNLRPYFRALFADASLAAGQPDSALPALDEALIAIEASGERWWEAEIHRLRGEVLLALGPGRRRAGEESLPRALQAARAQGARAFEARAESSLSRAAA
jgi:predicted ATPase